MGKTSWSLVLYSPYMNIPVTVSEFKVKKLHWLWLVNNVSKSHNFIIEWILSVFSWQKCCTQKIYLCSKDVKNRRKDHNSCYGNLISLFGIKQCTSVMKRWHKRFFCCFLFISLAISRSWLKTFVQIIKAVLLCKWFPDMLWYYSQIFSLMHSSFPTRFQLQRYM